MKSRFRGCLAGLALGDALGADFEGMPPGEYPVDCSAPLHYTDDTEMMINLTESLLEMECVLPENMARHFIEGLNPWRGYGPGTLRVLSLIKSGVPIDRATTMVFKEGSKGNGAAMRVAPIGLLYWYDD
ncbi:MAG: ADP-ribosylglycohydrolase family protein, partial [Nitrospirae bacterium]|nr:ADP-ribosylglycohydrolase family protein [Nitrospirota bacterium]